MSQQPFVIERTYNAPLAKVWDAITNENQMREWYFDISGFKPEVGFEFEFSGGEKGGEQYRHLCKVTAVQPLKKLAYTWRYDGYPGNSEVTFELFDEGDQTRVKLTHTGLESFAANGKMFQPESFAAGWTAIIGKNLKEFTEK